MSTHDRPMPSHPTTPSRASRAKLRALTNVFIIFCVLAGVMALTALVYIAYQNQKNGDLLVNCTTQGHPCYERGQKRTGAAIGTISDVIIAANACAVGIHAPLTEPQFVQFEACVRRHVSVVEHDRGLAR